MVQRLYECVFVHKKSNSVIHLGILCFGILHYIFTPFSIISVNNIATKLQIFLSFSLFVSGTIIQMKSHKILSELRNSNSNAIYFYPRGFLFDLIYSPHYLGEILIYFSFVYIYYNKYISNMFRDYYLAIVVLI